MEGSKRGRSVLVTQDSEDTKCAATCELCTSIDKLCYITAHEWKLHCESIHRQEVKHMLDLLIFTDLIYYLLLITISLWHRVWWFSPHTRGIRGVRVSTIVHTYSLYMFRRRDCVDVFAVCEMDACLLCRSTPKSISQWRKLHSNSLKHVVVNLQEVVGELWTAATETVSSSCLDRSSEYSIWVATFASTFFISIAANVTGSNRG